MGVNLIQTESIAEILELGRIEANSTITSEESSLDALALDIPAIDETPSERRYSSVIARSSWYEIHTQLLFQREFLPAQPENLLSGVKAIAMKQNKHLSRIAAHRFSNDPDLLYVCVHNPMTDLNIIEMKELVLKSHRDILLMLILPVCEPFAAQLENPCMARLNANKDKRFVTSLADMSCWLTILSAQIFSKVVVELPYTEQATLEASSLWHIMTDAMKSEISS